MTGPQHYQEAERLQRQADIALGRFEDGRLGPADVAAHARIAAVLAAEAQVHATLALAAATAEAGGLVLADRNATGWGRAVGEQT